MPAGFPGPFNMGKVMKQMQKFQEELERVQAETAERTVEAAAGGGAVKATVDGTGKVRSIQMDPAAVNPSDVEMLQDMVVAAVNEAIRQSREMNQQALARLYEQLGLPPLPGLPGLG